MRFLKLQVLLLVLAVLGVAALAADVVLKNRAETELAAAVEARAPGSNGVRAKISSFPFVGRLLVSGQVPRVVVNAQHASTGEVSLSDIRIEVEDVEMDSGEAMDGRAVVRSIGRGSVQADLSQAEVNELLPPRFSVQIEEGRAVVKGPVGIEAQLVPTSEGSIRLEAAGRSLFDLPALKTELVPCRPAASFIRGAVRFKCGFDEVPPILLDLAQR